METKYMIAAAAILVLIISTWFGLTRPDIKHRKKKQMQKKRRR